MPTYEYRCENCGKNFTLQMAMTEHEKGGVSCPDCKGNKVAPLYSSFYAKTSKKS